MLPWLLEPGSAVGGSTPAELDFMCLLRETCMAVWLVFTATVAVLIVVVVLMGSCAGAETGDVNEGGEMERGIGKVDGEEEMRVRKGRGSVGVWRGEEGDVGWSCRKGDWAGICAIKAGWIWMCKDGKLMRLRIQGL